MSREELCITIPLIPKDFAYEDYVSAVLNIGGYYLERGIHKRKGKDILELDIVTNKFSGSGVAKTISEIKSGGWGFPDIFKVRGWMDYLHFDKASFVVQVPDKNQDTYIQVSHELCIDLIVTEQNGETLSDANLKKIYSIPTKAYDKAAIENLRFSYALERKLTNDIHSTAKNTEGFLILRDYMFELMENTFFVSEPVDRLDRIFSLFSNHYHITSRLDQERVTMSYENTSKDADISKSSFEELFYNHDKPNKLYGALYVELQHRLSVLKYCVEDILMPVKEQNMAKMIDNIKHAELSSNIHSGIYELKKQHYFYLYPYFWQIFIYLFGGFILLDKKDEEYNLLADITGVPIQEIDNALSAFDILFPIAGGKWMMDVPHTQIRILKFMPSPFCGIGVNFRKSIYCPNKKLEELQQVTKYSHTYDDLIRYNNLAYNYLKKSKDVVLQKVER